MKLISNSPGNTNWWDKIDSKFSITPVQLKQLKNCSINLHKSLNNKKANVEKINKNLRRSIYAKRDIKKNQRLSKENIETLRPHIGICASKYFNVLNKKTKKNVKSGEPIYQSMIK